MKWQLTTAKLVVPPMSDFRRSCDDVRRFCSGFRIEAWPDDDDDDEWWLMLSRGARSSDMTRRSCWKRDRAPPPVPLARLMDRRGVALSTALEEEDDDDVDDDA